MNLPCGLGSYFETSLKDKGVTDVSRPIKPPVG